MSMESKLRQANVAHSNPTAKASRAPKIIKTSVLGTVKWFNEQDGFGFIQRGDTGQDVFFHFTAITRKDDEQQFCSIESGQKVQFDLMEAAKGPKAVNITGPGGVLIGGKPLEVKVRTEVSKVSKATTTEDLSHSHLDELLKVKEERDRLKEEMEELKKAMAKQRADMTAEFVKHKQTREATYQEHLEAQKSEYEKLMKEQQELMQEELDGMKNTLEAELSAVKAQFEKDLQAEEANFQKQLEAHQSECRIAKKQEEAKFQEQLEAQESRFRKESESKTDKSWMYIFGGVCLAAGFLAAKFLTK